MQLAAMVLWMWYLRDDLLCWPAGACDSGHGNCRGKSRFIIIYVQIYSKNLAHDLRAISTQWLTDSGRQGNAAFLARLFLNYTFVFVLQVQY